MSTIEDFKNAPVGATATRANGWRALKTKDDGRMWTTTQGSYFDDVDISQRGYTLDPAPAPAPATAREALDIAWELAHEVKEGQVIPVGAWLVDRRDNKIIVEKNTFFDIAVDEWGAENIRTLEPLPEPLPEWLDAPAVLAECLSCNEDGLVKSVHVNFIGERWVCTECQRTLPWRGLTDVTPLYPKEGQDA